ncbi:hypothetical protein PIB30_028455 [Stylosanthes scabra]|uniref:Remorin C-terminal domain-containing protein n=2 Tax=Stylosanthes scabra TaxID=79078 RepID=A0ABU6XB27_9FABA|nr:hypothetical protein [Stylosanthes scabra]
MDTVLNKIREVFTGTEEENKANDLSETRDHRTPKAQSFKEKKKGSGWLQRQFSRKMNDDYESIEHATAVAAAAFAINSQEFSEIPPPERRKTTPREISLTRSKSKMDGAKSPFSLPRPASRTFSGSFKSKSDQGDIKEPVTKISEPDQRDFNPAPPPVKRGLSFGEKKSNLGDHDGIQQAEIPEGPRRLPTLRTSEIQPATSDRRVPSQAHQPEPLMPPPPPPPPLPLPTPPARKQSSRMQSIRDTKADGWERNQLQKIKDRYEKLMETIDSWESRKKLKARRKLNKHVQSEDERKKAKALKKYEERVKYIEEIAGAARQEAYERKGKEEVKAKDKANTIRTTGELPKSCLCF